MRFTGRRAGDHSGFSSLALDDARFVLADGTPRWDVQRFGGGLFLVAAGALSASTVAFARDSLRPGLLPFYLLLPPLLLGMAVVQAVRRRKITWRLAAGFVAVGDLAIMTTPSSFAGDDATAALSSVILWVLPTLYIALFLSVTGLVVQMLVVTAGALVMLVPGNPAPHTLALQAATVVLGTLCPAVLVLVLRVQLHASVSRARRLAVTDPLTGLLNRRGLEEQFTALAEAAQRQGTAVGVIVADVDHFKRVNDELGHGQGDDVLRVVAAATAACVRKDDLVVRLGGEEIGVIVGLPPAEVSVLAERIRQSVESEGRPWAVTASLGVSWSGTTTGDPARLLWHLIDEADTRMYEAKRAGRNQVVLPA